MLMAYKVEIYKSSSWVDISNYVEGISEIPFIAKNADYTLNFESTDFELASTYTTHTLNIGDRIFISTGSVALFNGKVSEKEYDYKKRNYKIDVDNVLEGLNNYRVSYLDTAFSSSVESQKVVRSIFLRDYDVVFYHGLIEACLDTIGYGFDNTTYLPSSVFGTLTAISSSTEDETPVQVQISGAMDSDIYFLPGQVFCINQDYVYPPWQCDQTKTISVKELLIQLLSFGRFSLIPKNYTDFYLVRENNTASDNDYITNYSDTIVKKENSSFKIDFKTVHTPYVFRSYLGHYFYINEFDSTPSPVSYTSSYGNQSDDTYEITWYNHFMPWYLIWDGWEGTHHAWALIPQVDVPTTTIAKQKINEKCSDINIIKYDVKGCNTNIYFSSEIDIKNNETKVVKKTFDY